MCHFGAANSVGTGGGCRPKYTEHRSYAINFPTALKAWLLLRLIEQSFCSHQIFLKPSKRI